MPLATYSFVVGNAHKNEQAGRVQYPVAGADSKACMLAMRWPRARARGSKKSARRPHASPAAEGRHSMAASRATTNWGPDKTGAARGNKVPPCYKCGTTAQNDRDGARRARLCARSTPGAGGAHARAATGYNLKRRGGLRRGPPQQRAHACGGASEAARAAGPGQAGAGP